jgi:hypothetical protein
MQLPVKALAEKNLRLTPIQRCLRLRKDCQPAPTVRKKGVSKTTKSTKASAANKTAALEEKFDSLVQMFKHVQSPQAPVDPSTRFALKDPDTYPACTPPIRAGSIAPKSDLPTTVERFPTAIISPLPADHLYPIESEAELEENLIRYRTRMVPCFPIVMIGKDVTVRKLREERPFLFLVIRATCSKNMARQVALGIQVKKVLGEEMLLEGTRSLDLFLGLLCFGAWGHYNILQKPVITTIVQLAVSLAFDLGLNKPLPKEQTRVMLDYTARGCPKPAINVVVARTMEERRAIIGLFLLSSV